MVVQRPVPGHGRNGAQPLTTSVAVTLAAGGHGWPDNRRDRRQRPTAREYTGDRQAAGCPPRPSRRGIGTTSFDRFSALSDSAGVANFSELPLGNWLYEANANHRIPVQGEVNVAAGGAHATASLGASPEDFELSFTVQPTLVQDHYEVTLTATYAVQVPTPTLHVTPNMLFLDFRCGNVVTGTLNVTNPSLVGIDNVGCVLVASSRWRRSSRTRRY